MTATLDERGQAIWDAFGASELPPPLRALVEEAARIADALDKLDRLLRGRQDEWAVVLTDMDGNVSLVIDKLLNERRQHALAFSALLRDLDRAGVTVDAQRKPQDEGDFVDELADRRQSKSAS